jgi:hypothetical protein
VVKKGRRQHNETNKTRPEIGTNQTELENDVNAKWNLLQTGFKHRDMKA